MRWWLISGMTGRAATGPGRGWLSELDLPAVSREIVTAWRSPAPSRLRLSGPGGELHQPAKADPRVKVLRTLPGVGEFTALVMLAEIGDITRFASARKLASWAGLTPTVRGLGPDRPARAYLQAGLGVAAVGPQPGGADRQALPRIHRHLRRHHQAAREKDRYHRDRPQAADPRLPPARRRPGCRHMTRRHRRQHGPSTIT